VLAAGLLLTDAGNHDGSRRVSVLTPTGLALLLEALTDRKAQRRLIGRLRPRLIGRPRSIVRLPRRQCANRGQALCPRGLATAAVAGLGRCRPPV